MGNGMFIYTYEYAAKKAWFLDMAFSNIPFYVMGASWN